MVKVTRLPRIHTLVAEQCTEWLTKGILVVEINSESGARTEWFRRPNAQEMAVCVKFLKDNNIDSEAEEGEPIVDTQKALRVYNDDPLLIPERDGVSR